jgi:carbonic anhydrase
MPRSFSRREMLQLTCAACAYAMATALAWSSDTQPEPVAAAVALQRLKDGNLRFASGKLQREHQDLSRVKEIATGQHPFATILGCSDSRVAPEVIFDQGLGDVFIARVAGTVVSTEVLGSIQYAALHLHTKLFVVLGHEDCGAVKAAMGDAKSEPQPVQTLLIPIQNAIRNAHLSGISPAQVTQAVEANTRQSAADLRKALRGNEAGLLVNAAVYELATGKVRWL